jgi:protein TonB
MSDSVHPDLNSAADFHLRNLLAESIEEPWYRSLPRNLRESLFPAKLPPLLLTSQPVDVKDIWGSYGRQKESGLMSLAIHCGVAALLFTVLSNPVVQVEVKKAGRLFAPVFAPLPETAPKPKTLQGGGGGGDRSLLAASIRTRSEVCDPAIRATCRRREQCESQALGGDDAHRSP